MKTLVKKPRVKNECAKTRPIDNPYEVWQGGGWTWKVLKKYQVPDKEKGNPYARWFCFVTSPYCPGGEYGDTYVHDIINHATKAPYQRTRQPVAAEGTVLA